MYPVHDDHHNERLHRSFSITCIAFGFIAALAVIPVIYVAATFIFAFEESKLEVPPRQYSLLLSPLLFVGTLVLAIHFHLNTGFPRLQPELFEAIAIFGFVWNLLIAILLVDNR